MDDIVWPPKKPAAGSKRPLPSKVPALKRPGVAAPLAPLAAAATSIKQNVDEMIKKASSEFEPAPPEKPPKKHRWIFLAHIHRSKKRLALVIVVFLILLAGAGFGAKYLYQRSRHIAPQAAEPKVALKPVEVKPVTEPSLLTGVEVMPELNKRPVTGIMIENSPDARPQAGLKDAGIVYEAIAEGGITRFLAVFQPSMPDYIGPIRSVRPYYLDFIWPFDAGIAHVGGAPQALADIKSLGIKDLDQFFNSGAYYRITQRFAPHNVYSDFTKLDALNASKGFSSSSFTSFPRKKADPAKAPNANNIALAISGPLYNVSYKYDGTTNTYLRSEAGAPHKDDRSGTQLAPNVVIALVVSRGIAGDGQHTDYKTTGSGHMYVFQDGIMTEGTWSKSDRHAQFVFTNAEGKPLALNPGQTWITLVDSNANVTASQ